MLIVRDKCISFGAKKKARNLVSPNRLDRELELSPLLIA